MCLMMTPLLYYQVGEGVFTTPYNFNVCVSERQSKLNSNVKLSMVVLSSLAHTHTSHLDSQDHHRYTHSYKCVHTHTLVNACVCVCSSFVCCLSNMRFKSNYLLNPKLITAHKATK